MTRTNKSTRFLALICVFTALALVVFFHDETRYTSDIAFVDEQHTSLTFGHGQSRIIETSLLKKHSCRDVVSEENQCDYVSQFCITDSGMRYLKFYYCSSTLVRPAAASVIVLWLIILFSSIGITASDFLCVNLSAISVLLGMSQTLTGVTLLAFGNGSPDVFSTFAAMGSHSGSLAVGELIGAAGFITSAVVGCMAFVKPFEVPRKTFIRDLSAFLIAATFSLVFLFDGHLSILECMIMITFYFAYVVVVLAWHTIIHYQPKKHPMHALQRTESDLDEGVLPSEWSTDNSTNTVTTAHMSQDRDSGSFATLMSLQHGLPAHIEGNSEGNERADVRSFSNLLPGETLRYGGRRHSGQWIRPSILDALEYSRRPSQDSTSLLYFAIGKDLVRRHSDIQDEVSVRSAQPRGASSSADDGRGTSRRSTLSLPLFGRPQSAQTTREQERHISHHMIQKSYSGSQTLQRQRSLDLNRDLSQPQNHLNSSHISTAQQDQAVSSTTDDKIIEVPAIRVTDTDDTPTNDAFLHETGATSDGGDASSTTLLADSGSSVVYNTFSEPSTEEISGVHDDSGVPVSDHKNLLLQLLYIRDLLLPTLMDWHEKGLLSKIVSILTGPLILFLTITVPVTTSSTTEDDQMVEVNNTDTIVQDTQAISSEATVSSHVWKHRLLLTAQVFSSPLILCLIIRENLGEYLNKGNILWWIGLSMITSCCVLGIVTLNRWYGWKTLNASCLAFLGFLTSTALISLIAGEVVAVLKAIGVISGISDAILGLTVFAIGNSCSDLFANLAIARLGYPVMAFSACFGGPMLNLLLGVGIGGLIMTLHETNKHYRHHPEKDRTFVPYEIEVGTSLMVSGLALVVTLAGLLVFVPINAWKNDRKVGVALITLWLTSIVVNVGLEVAGIARSSIQV